MSLGSRKDAGRRHGSWLLLVSRCRVVGTKGRTALRPPYRTPTGTTLMLLNGEPLISFVLMLGSSAKPRAPPILPVSARDI